MADPTTTRGGKLRVLLETTTAGVYASPCGFMSKTFTLTKSLDDVMLPDCDDATKVAWLGRDATSLGITVGGEGVLAKESIKTWLDATESPDSVKVKIEIEFPGMTVTYTGRMMVSTFTAGAPSPTGRCTASVEMSSDGAMVRTST